MRRLRKIKVGLLIRKAVVYRVVVLFTQIGFMWSLTRNIEFSVMASILWNIINTVEYFGFDYVFAKLYKVGKK
jgi:hypothetical protein